MEDKINCGCEHASHIPTNGCQEEGRHYVETRHGVFYACTNCLEEHLWQAPLKVGAQVIPSSRRVHDGKNGNSHFGKRHYKAIASMLSPYFESESLFNTCTPTDIAQRLADLFEQDNPLFDRGLFYQQTGVKHTKAAQS